MSVLSLIIILYVTAQVELATNFSRLEEKSALDDLSRALDAIYSERIDLYDLAGYLAQRNYIYTYLETGDPYFINNLATIGVTDESLHSLGINLLLIMDSYGQNVFSMYLDADGNSKPLPADLTKQLSFYGFCEGCLDKRSRYSGIIILSDNPMLIATQPIIKSNENNRSVGRVVVGRYLSRNEIARLSDVTHLRLTLCALDDPAMPLDFKEAQSHLSGDNPTDILLLNESFLAAYALLNDIYDSPTLILRVDQPRSIYNLGFIGLRNFLILFSAAGFLFLISTLLYLDKFALSRLTAFTEGVKIIGKSHDIASRLEVKGNDELSDLAISINDMLKALEQAQNELVKSEYLYKAVVNEQSDFILRTLADGTITFANDAFCRFFSIANKEAIGCNVNELVHEDLLKPVEKLIMEISTKRPSATYGREFIRQGRSSWILWTIQGIFDKLGTLIEIQAVGKDLTEIKMAEEALKQSERRLGDIIDFMPEALLAINLKGKVIVWNKAMEALTGVKAEDILGKDNYEHSLPFYRTRRPILVDMVLRQSKDFEEEYIRFKKEGNAVIGETFIPNLGPKGSYLLAKAAPLYDSSGDVVGAIESIRDLTESRLIEETLNRTKMELNIAAEIQKSFIPKKVPDIPGFDIAAMTVPATEVGGDFYDFIPLPNGHWGLVIADVAGKSMPAAIFMALSRNIIRANVASSSSTSEVLINSNRMIALDAVSGMFVTLLYGIIDEKAHAFRFANAGHEYPLLLRSANCQLEEEKESGVALGIVEDTSYIERCIEFSPSDAAIFYTDGVTEALNDEGEMYGEDRLLNVIRNNCKLNAKDLIERIFNDILNFCNGTEQHDDITLIALKSCSAPIQSDFLVISREEDISNALNHIDKMMSHSGFNKEAILDFEVAIEEASINIIRHGYKSSPGEILLSLNFNVCRMMAILEDCASPFDPTKFDKPDLTQSLDKRPIGGLGIYLIKCLTDEVRYELKNGKNRLTIIKEMAQNNLRRKDQD